MDVQDGGVRRETQDENWASFKAEELANQEEVIFRVLSKAPYGLTDIELKRIIPESVIKPHGVTAGRRRLVIAGRVKWTGEKRKPIGARVPIRIWTIGKDSDEEIAGTRRWPTVYTEIREAIKAGNVGTERLSVRLRRVADRLETGTVRVADVRPMLLDLATFCVAAIEQADATVDMGRQT